MRLIVCLLLALAGSTSAWAQIAAPTLAPGSASITDILGFREPSLLPLNPAVMPWSGRSTAGGGITRGKAVPLEQGASGADINANFGGTQQVYDRYAWGVQAMTASEDGSDGTSSFDILTLAGGRRWGDWLAGGVGYQSYSQMQKNGKAEFVDLKGGVSLRFLDDWYLGALTGQEKYTNQSKTGSTWSSTQTIAGYGLGFRNEGPWQLHVELSSVDYGEAKNDKGDDIFSTKKSWAVVEFAHDPWLAGLTVNGSTLQIGKAEDPATYRANGYELTLGLLPKKGFSVSFQYAYSRVEFGVSSGSTTKFDSYTRGLSAVYVY